MRIEDLINSTVLDEYYADILDAYPLRKEVSEEEIMKAWEEYVKLRYETEV